MIYAVAYLSFWVGALFGFVLLALGIMVIRYAEKKAGDGK